MPKNFINVTKQYAGKTITVVGVGPGRDGNNITIKRAAWHESAHAICGRLLKFQCGGASINLDGTSHAAVAAVHSLHWDYHERGGDIMSSVLDKICVCWSGGVAEDIKFGGADDAGDRRQIKNLAEKYYASDQDIERARERAHGLLIQPKHWDTVERLAAELLNKKTLTGAAIDKLVSQIGHA